MVEKLWPSKVGHNSLLQSNLMLKNRNFLYCFLLGRRERSSGSGLVIPIIRLFLQPFDGHKDLREWSDWSESQVIGTSLRGRTSSTGRL